MQLAIIYIHNGTHCSVFAWVKYLNFYSPAAVLAFVRAFLGVQGAVYRGVLTG